VQVDPRPHDRHPAPVLRAIDLVELLEAHRRITTEPLASIAVRAGFGEQYLQKLARTAKANPDHRIDSVTFERVVDALGLVARFEPREPKAGDVVRAITTDGEQIGHVVEAGDPLTLRTIPTGPKSRAAEVIRARRVDLVRVVGDRSCGTCGRVVAVRLDGSLVCGHQE